MKTPSILLLLLGIFSWAEPCPAADDPWARARWIQKLARTLQSNEGLPSPDVMQGLLKKSDQEIIELFMAQPEFGDTSAAAFLYFLGRSVDRIRIPTETGFEYSPDLFAVPQALSSARNVMLGKKLEIFDWRPALVLNPMRDPRPIFGELPPEQTRARILQAMLAGVNKAIQNFKKADGSWDKEAGCAKLNELYIMIDEGVGLMAAGFDFRLEERVREVWLMALTPDTMGGSVGIWEQSACLREDRSAEFIVKRLEEYRQAFQSFFAQIPAGLTQTASLRDLLPIQTPASLPPLVTAFTRDGFWNRLPNSSSNHNRKRAAYMLQTYFCDGLGEISVEAGSDHANKHASDPACMSCHYKLDPMAGLFRENGMQGGDYSGLNHLIFDDLGEVAGEAKRLYLKNWQNDSTGRWDVGYFIEPGKPHPRWQGSTLEGFMPFVATAKESQRCFVKRMAEFFIRSEQSYDSAWLRELTDEFAQNANSGLGFRTLVKRLVMSRAFAASNPDPNFCYDTPLNAPGNRPPCKIAGIIEENCKSCHNSGFASGELDLSQWIDVGGGRMGFRHLQDGLQLAPELSFERIRKRITSEELGPKMPLGRIMSPTDRQLLYEWLSQPTLLQETKQ